MATIYNTQRTQGVVIVDDGTTMYGGRRTIGIRQDGAGLFSANLLTLGVAVLAQFQPVYNDMPVIGAVLISDGRELYNDALVKPAALNNASDFASSPAPTGWRWDFVTSNGNLVTSGGVPVVALVGE